MFIVLYCLALFTSSLVLWELYRVWSKLREMPPGHNRELRKHSIKLLGAGISIVMASCLFQILNWSINPYLHAIRPPTMAHAYLQLFFTYIGIASLLVAFSIIMANWMSVDQVKAMQFGWSPVAKGIFWSIFALAILASFGLSAGALYSSNVGRFGLVIMAAAVAILCTITLVSGLLVLRKVRYLSSELGQEGERRREKMRRMALQLIGITSWGLFCIITLAVLAAVQSQLQSSYGIFMTFRIAVPHLLSVVSLFLLQWFFRAPASARQILKEATGVNDQSSSFKTPLMQSGDAGFDEDEEAVGDGEL